LIRACNAQNEDNVVETVKYAELSIQLLPKESAYLLAQAVITLGFTHWAYKSGPSHARWMDDMQKLGNRC
jgi:hypothetical protein